MYVCYVQLDYAAFVQATTHQWQLVAFEKEEALMSIRIKEELVMSICVVCLIWWSDQLLTFMNEL